MSKAWKTSDGGTITPVGASSFQSASAGTHVIVSAGANVRGVRICTAALSCNGAAAVAELRAAAVPIVALRYSNGVFAKDLFIPAGVAVDAFIATGGVIAVTYEIL
ncbi:MAG: hypothetical protein ACK4OG_06695 [Parvibaculum sp.]